MAYLTQLEFCDAVSLLAGELGLQRLRDKLVRLNALVSRRRVASPAALADQLYMLTSGLRKQVPATVAFQSLWNEAVNAKLGEEKEKQLEELAKPINECLTEKDEVKADKGDDLEHALAAYAGAMTAAVGREMTYTDMLMKAVPAVAARLRTGGLPAVPAGSESGAAGTAESAGASAPAAQTKGTAPETDSK